MSDELKSVLPPVRPYAQICSYTGGSHKFLQGSYSYFEQDQSNIGRSINHIATMDGPTNIFVMLCGRRTAAQEKTFADNPN